MTLRPIARLTSRIATATLAGSLALGGTALASGDGSGPSGDRAAKICNHLDEIDDWLNGRITEVQHRIDYFTTMRAKAEAAGKTNLVARIDTALGRLNNRLTRLQNRISEIDTWAASHCNVTPPTTEPPTTEPPTTEPPTAEPPTTEPPSTDVPTTSA